MAVDLGWFLVSNSGSLPATPESIVGGISPGARVGQRAVGLRRRRARLRRPSTGDWDTQLDLTWIVGLLLRGWRKGLDTESGAVLGSHVSAADDLAWWSARAVEAAERRL